MKKQKISTVVMGIILSLVMLFNAGVSVSASEVKASDYLSSYTAYLTPLGNGEMDIHFKVFAVGLADQVGVTKIVVEQKIGGDWYPVRTYDSSNTTGLVGYNAFNHMGYITYTGSVLGEYRAQVTVYAKKGTGSDSRIITTSSVIL